MPELAEVAFYCRRWSPSIGAIVEDVLLHADKRVFRGHGSAKAATLAGRELMGRRLVSTRTHGKQMLHGFEGGRWLAVHLGMTGELSRPLVEGLRLGRHDHLALRMSDGHCLVFTDPRQFGVASIEVVEDGREPDWWRALPPEISSPAFTRSRVSEALRRHARSPIKPLLLDQAWFPGIGNWMADELLWRLRWRPSALAGLAAASPESAPALWRETRRLCRDALKVISHDWGDPPASWLFRHRWKDGGFCPRRSCGTPLAREDLRGRTTCWCPRCQG